MNNRTVNERKCAMGMSENKNDPANRNEKGTRSSLTATQKNDWRNH